MTRYEADSAMPAPAIPSGPTSATSSTTLTARPASDAGTLRDVMRSRPTTTT